jgi:hypothetical protein
MSGHEMTDRERIVEVMVEGLVPSASFVEPPTGATTVVEILRLNARSVLAALDAAGYEIHPPDVCMDRALTALRAAFTTDKGPIRVTSDDVPVGGDS